MELALELFNGQGLGNQIFCITSLYKLALLLKRKPVILNHYNYKERISFQLINLYSLLKIIFLIMNI